MGCCIPRYQIIGRLYKHLIFRQCDFDKCCGYILVDEKGRTKVVDAKDIDKYVDLDLYDCKGRETVGVRLKDMDAFLPIFDNYLRRVSGNAFVVLKMIYKDQDLYVEYLNTTETIEIKTEEYSKFIKMVSYSRKKILNMVIQRDKLVERGNFYVPIINADGEQLIDMFVYNKQFREWFLYSRSASIELPEYITHISSSTFVACEDLRQLRLHNKLESIGYNAFRDTALTELTLPSSLNMVLGGILPKSVTKVDMRCSWGALDTQVFKGTNIDKITFHEKALRDDSKYGSYIPSGAFEDCMNLKRIEIPECIESIDVRSFANTGLEGIVIPQNVEELGYGAFFECDKLERVEIEGTIKSISDCGYDDEEYEPPFALCNIKEVVLHKPIDPEVFAQLGFEDGVKIIKKW